MFWPECVVMGRCNESKPSERGQRIKPFITVAHLSNRHCCGESNVKKCYLRLRHLLHSENPTFSKDLNSMAVVPSLVFSNTTAARLSQILSRCGVLNKNVFI